MIKKLFTALFADENILCFHKDSGDAVSFCNEKGILSIDLNNINLDNTNHNEDNLENIIHIKVLAWHIKFEKRKVLKKKVSEELMPTA